MTVDATAPGVGGSAKLEIVNSPGYPVSGEITLEHDQISALIPPRYREQAGDLSGKVSAIARGSGRLADPAGIRGRIDLRALDVTMRGTRIELAAPGSLTLADDRIAVDTIDLRLGKSTRATLRGQLGDTPLPNPLQVHLEGPLSELLDIGSRASGATPPPHPGGRHRDTRSDCRRHAEPAAAGRHARHAIAVADVWLACTGDRSDGRRHHRSDAHHAAHVRSRVAGHVARGRRRHCHGALS